LDNLKPIKIKEFLEEEWIYTYFYFCAWLVFGRYKFQKNTSRSKFCIYTLVN